MFRTSKQLRFIYFSLLNSTLKITPNVINVVWIITQPLGYVKQDGTECIKGSPHLPYLKDKTEDWLEKT